jgi:tungstate transport system permease protein
LDYLWQAFLKALELIYTFNPEVIQIAGRTLYIGLSSTAIASVICIPLGAVIHFNQFWGKRLLINLIQTFYSTPTVVIGLFVLIMLSRAGPLGSLDILFTPPAIIVGQVLLITPILLGLTISALKSIDTTIVDTALSMGAARWQLSTLVIKEARFAVMAAVILGFGRAISEVGISLMVGGNIRGVTRVITTAISLEAGKGDIELSLALGMILIFLALLINIIFNRIQQR